MSGNGGEGGRKGEKKGREGTGGGGRGTIVMGRYGKGKERVEKEKQKCVQHSISVPGYVYIL